MMNPEAQEENEAVPHPSTSGPRPHRCEICQRSFREMTTLRKHEQLHRADRPYACQTCGKSFLWSSNLKVHERVHTGERPYKCKICHRCFTQSNDLRRHERNVHMQGKLYSCKTLAGYPSSQSASTSGQMNLAAYQAFALQQRAILQHALTYESMVQNSVTLTTPSYIHHAGLAQSDKDLTVSTSEIGVPCDRDNIDEARILKLEQVSPPPQELKEQTDSNHDKNANPKHSGHSPLPSARQSPTSASLSMGSITNGHACPSESPKAHPSESPNGQRNECLNSHKSQYSENPSYFSSFTDHQSVASVLHNSFTDIQSVVALPHSFPSSFSLSPTAENGMDLRMNKSTSSANLEGGDLDWKVRHASLLLSKSPGSESETDSKRDVTTTSFTPTVDSGIHHCPHCYIFFHDFTMFNLHQSLHSPMDEDPFLCPSCRKHCQDRIEFMFHIVWHVRYPHTIPKYRAFRENHVLSKPEPE